MKQILIAALLFIGLSANAQTIQQNNAYGLLYKATGGSVTTIIPKDTAIRANDSTYAAIATKQGTGRAYFFDKNFSNNWIELQVVGDSVNNYPTSLGYSTDILTLGRNGLSNLTATIPLSTKLNISDTAAMLAPYATDAQITNLTTIINNIDSVQDNTVYTNGLLKTGNQVVALYQQSIWNAGQIQGYNVAATAPTDGQVLLFNGDNNRYEPGDLSSIGGVSQSQLDDSTEAIRNDFASAGTANTNIGSGYRILKPSTQGLKTLFGTNGILIDSTTNTDGLTIQIDSSKYATLYDLTQVASGVTTLGAIGSSSNANGATISGNTLNLEPASSSFGGIITTGSQTIAGSKTFSGTTTFTGLLNATSASGALVAANHGTSPSLVTNNTSTSTSLVARAIALTRQGTYNGAIGSGVSVEFSMRNGSGTLITQAGIIEMLMANATAGSESFDYNFKSINGGGTAATKFTIKGNGDIIVASISTYADNAAALAGGKVAGTLYYRTGHGLDIVQ
jgi:hypothetical protein